MGYAVRITYHAVDVVTGADKTPGIVAAEATGAGRKKWGGGELRSRKAAANWENGSPYSSYQGTPVSGVFSVPGSPYPPSPYTGNGSMTPGGQAYGLGLNSPAFGPTSSPRSPQSALNTTAAAAGSPYSPPSPYLPPSVPNTASLYGHFPPTPNPPPSASYGFPHSPMPASSTFAAQQGTAPPRRENGSLGGTKKDD